MRKKTILGAGVVILFALVLTIPGDTAYQVARPISTTGGRINQWYKYGEELNIGNQVYRHRGVDLSYPLGTPVFPVSNGWVVDLREDLPDGDETPGFGNYVLIRHVRKHYDRTTSQWAHVYSIYAHLSHLSVPVSVGQYVTVDPPMLIGQVDDTGTSSVHHLHFQIVIHPLPDRVLRPNNTLESEIRSRNPEPWLTPYNGNTATAIGKLTYSNGNAVANKIICGMIKPPNGQNGTFEWSRTYSYPEVDPNVVLNADDIVVDNFATTDVSPGTYHLIAYDYDFDTGADCGVNPFFRDLGNYTFTAGRITYVGLYPVALPFVRKGYSGWDSTIYVRNNSTSKTAQIVTTYFNLSGTVNSQQTNFLGANSNMTLVPPSGFDGSALIVGSEDLAVSVLDEHSPPYASSAYQGVAKPETTVWVPLVHRNNWGYNSLISIYNPGPAESFVQMDFIPTTDGSPCTQWEGLTVNETKRIDTASLDCLGTKFVGSLKISTGQSPLAVTLIQYGDIWRTLLESSNAISAGDPLYAPLIQNNNSGYTSGYNLQNAAGFTQSSTTTYYNPSGGLQSNCTQTHSLGPDQAVTVYPAPPANCTTTPVLSAMLNPFSSLMAAQVNQIVPATPKGSDYRAISQPTTTVYVPRLLNFSGSWSTGLQVQNAGSSATTVTITYYNYNGTQYGPPYTYSLQPKASATLYPLPIPLGFTGSAKLTAGQPLAVIVNFMREGSGDILATHEGLNR